MSSDILQPKNSLVVYKNANATIKLTVTNPDGSPTNLTGGRLVFTVKSSTKDSSVTLVKTSDSSAQILLKSATGGIAEVYLLPADTKNLASREYVFDVWLILSGKQFPIIPPTIFDLRSSVGSI